MNKWKIVPEKGNYKRKKMKNQDLKSTVTKMENLLDGHKSRLDKAEKKSGTGI